ncbi:hypothetical protein GCM10027416_14530 [Okibacterium endophyticum]
MTTRATMTRTALPLHRTRVELVGVNEFLWRVIAPDGRVIGHLERSNTAQGDVFIAKRFNTLSSRFVDLGRFWAIDDAVDCLTDN